MASEQVKNAKSAFQSGVTKPIKKRRQHLEAFLHFVQDYEDAIVKSMEEDMRKHCEEAKIEVLIAKNHLRHLLYNLESWARPDYAHQRLVEVLDKAYINNDPYGLVLVMGAWNVPLLTILPVAGAIAAGNAVAIKPSHNSPAFSALLAKTLPDYLPAAAFPVIQGDVAATGDLLRTERFDYIYYTGSVRVGRLVHEAANRTLTPTTLELGGKNPVYIDASADVRLAATRIIWGKCFNAGQACVAPDYVLCAPQTRDAFIQCAREALVRFYGTEAHRSCPIVNDAHYKRLVGLLAGLTVALGGRKCPMDNYIEPTIVVDVPRDHPIMHEEIFGPILPVICVETPDEAVEFINGKEKALALYVFAKKQAIIDLFVNETSSGGVTVNDVIMHLLVEDLPFGGVGMSGMGRYKGKHSFDTFVHKKSVLIKRFPWLMEKVYWLRYPPYSAQKGRLTGILLKSRRGLPMPALRTLFVFFVGLAIGFCIYYLIDK